MFGCLQLNADHFEWANGVDLNDANWDTDMPPPNGSALASLLPILLYINQWILIQCVITGIMKHLVTHYLLLFSLLLVIIFSVFVMMEFKNKKGMQFVQKQLKVLFLHFLSCGEARVIMVTNIISFCNIQVAVYYTVLGIYSAYRLACCP